MSTRIEDLPVIKKPDIAMIDRDGALVSIAISLKRIADSMESSQEALHELVRAVYSGK